MARAHRDGTITEGRFASVTSRIDNIDPLARPFRVEDAHGNVPVRQVIDPKNDTVQLVLERPLTGAAVVLAGYGLDPAPIPMDRERLLPILVSTDIPVETA